MAQKIEIIRGTSNTFNIHVMDANGDAYALASGEKLLFGVKEKPEDEEAVISKAITEGVDGVYTVTLSPADTIGVPYGRYVYDVGLESGEDFFNVIEASPFVIEPNITKRGDGS